MGIDWRWFRKGTLLLMLPGVAVACSPPPSSQKAAPPRRVAALDPCGLLGGTQQGRLGLNSGAPQTQGYRRSCQYLGSGNGESTQGAQALISLEIITRDSTATNTIADARRMAGVYGRERGSTVTTITTGGRTVYQVGYQGYLGTVCSLLFTVDATSSVEVQASWGGPVSAQGCGLGSVPQEIAQLLPPPDNRYQTPSSDRPVDVAAVRACELISDAQQAKLHLESGQPIGGTSSPSCQFTTGAVDPGSVDGFVVDTFTTGAAALAQNAAKDAAELYTGVVTDYGPTVRTVNGRIAYQTLDIAGPGVGAQSSCIYWFDVTQASTVQVEVDVLGMDPAPACQIMAGLAPQVEAQLPLLAL